MTKTNMDLSELLAKHDQGDLLRSIAEAAGRLDHPLDPGQMRRQMTVVAPGLARRLTARPLHRRFGL